MSSSSSRDGTVDDFLHDDLEAEPLKRSARVSVTRKPQRSPGAARSASGQGIRGYRDLRPSGWAAFQVTPGAARHRVRRIASIGDRAAQGARRRARFGQITSRRLMRFGIDVAALNTRRGPVARGDASPGLPRGGRGGSWAARAGTTSVGSRRRTTSSDAEVGVQDRAGPGVVQPPRSALLSSVQQVLAPRHSSRLHYMPSPE